MHGPRRFASQESPVKLLQSSTVWARSQWTMATFQAVQIDFHSSGWPLMKSQIVANLHSPLIVDWLQRPEMIWNLNLSNHIPNIIFAEFTAIKFKSIAVVFFVFLISETKSDLRTSESFDSSRGPGCSIEPFLCDFVHGFPSEETRF